MLYLYLIAWARRFRLLGMAVPLLWIGESHACFLYNMFAWDGSSINEVNMENAQKPHQNYISNLISNASDVLNYSLTEIKKKYSEMPICLMEYIEKGIHENIFEIRFDDENATLSCGFDDNKQCNICYLFFDDIEVIDEYITYLNDRHDYDFMRSSWILSNCYMKIKITKDDRFFIFYK